VHVVWQEIRDGNFEIYYKRSTDGGVNWGLDTRLSYNSGYSAIPCVKVLGPFIHVVWRENSDGNEEIYYKRSIDSGVNWGADTRLTNFTGTSNYPSISLNAQVVHVVWQDNRDGNTEIYYKRSTDGGVSWGTDSRLTNNTYDSEAPSIGITGSVLHVVWHDYRDGNYEIYYKRSTDGGSSWGSDTRLTNSTGFSFFPSLSVSGQGLHVVWYYNRDGNNEVYYMHSTNGGINWESDTRLTNSNGDSHLPSIEVSGTILHVVWYDDRDGNNEIYYKRNPTGNLVGMININSEIIPDKFELHQNYPNPFNPSTTIRFGIVKQTNAKIMIYDVLGRQVAILVNESFKPGTYEVIWNASSHSSGIYYYIMQTEDFRDVKRMVLIK